MDCQLTPYPFPAHHRRNLEKLNGELQAQSESEVPSLPAEVDYTSHLEMHAQSSPSQNRAHQFMCRRYQISSLPATSSIAGSEVIAVIRVTHQLVVGIYLQALCYKNSRIWLVMYAVLADLWNDAQFLLRRYLRRRSHTIYRFFSKPGIDMESFQKSGILTILIALNSTLLPLRLPRMSRGHPAMGLS